MNEYLAQKFPDMRPIQSAPGLSTVNGIGMRLFGRRDYDQETNSYVTTHVFCILFIPFVAAGAYRVIDAPNGGWYFLGNVPMSRVAKSWNYSLLLVIFGLIGFGLWHNHTHSMDYLAGKQIEEADELVAQQQAGKAAQIYREEMGKQTKHAAVAKDKLRGLIEQPPASLKEAAAIYRVALDLHRQRQDLVPDLFDRGLTLAEAHTADDPEGALALVDSITPLAPKKQAVLDIKRKLLESMSAANPNNVELACRLAAIYESQGELAKCEALLTPLQQKLGDSEGAAILGRIFAGKGKLAEARTLLQPYVRTCLPKLRNAERAYEASVKQTQERIINEIEQNRASGWDMPRYKSLGEEAQKKMVSEYLAKRMIEDPALKLAQNTLSEQSGVVNVALDLGMVLLQEAQQLNDPAARKKGLEAAEKVFLEIRSFAGEADSYRLNLGQVYYWLGKHADGKKEFDDLLKARKRDYTILMALTHILREVGEDSEGRTLVEEAYKNQLDPKKKHDAAFTRSLLFKDNDDQILWLGRADQTAPHVKAALSGARGNKAVLDGKHEQAAVEFRNAIAAYAQLPETAGTLNNAALAHFSLYHQTNDKDELVRGMDKIDRALALDPSDSILLINAASLIADETIRDIVGKRIDLKVLKQRGAGSDLLSFLFDDTAAKEKIIEQLVKHPGTIKARGYCEKLMILAPKGVNGYYLLYHLHSFAQNAEGLRSLADRLEKIELDQQQQVQESMDLYRGKDDPKKIELVKKAIEKAKAVLTEARKVGGVTLAVALKELATFQMESAVFKLPVDVNEIVKMAEEAHEVAASDATRNLLATALTTRAHLTLSKENPEYAKMAAITERSLKSNLVPYVLGHPGPLRAKVLANADVQRVASIKLEQFKRLPTDVGASSWILINAAHPKEGEKIAEAIRKDPLGSFDRRIARKLSPLDARQALAEYWTLQINGKNAEASKFLQEFRTKGVPLPPEMQGK